MEVLSTLLPSAMAVHWNWFNSFLITFQLFVTLLNSTERQVASIFWFLALCRMYCCCIMRADRQNSLWARKLSRIRVVGGHIWPTVPGVGQIMALFGITSVFTPEGSYCFQHVLAIAILSVRLSHGWISQKRFKLRSPNFHHRLPGRL